MELTPVIAIKKVIDQQEQAFTEIAQIHGAVTFKREAFMALDIIRKSDYLTNVALNNPASLRSAVMNVALIGLSLNPANKHAYLVPRKGEICLDVSYMGMIQLATDTGSIQWAQAEIVRKNDKYVFQGVGKEPVHEMNPFDSDKDRGDIIGAYCVAKTIDGDYLVCQMNINEIYGVRNRSEAWKAGKSNPWLTDEGEMIKKTVIKRAAKTWPKSDKTERLNQAIDVVNQYEGINFDEDVTPPEENKLDTLKEKLNTIENGEKRMLIHASIKFQREIIELDDLTGEEVDYCLRFLEQNIKGQQ